MRAICPINATVSPVPIPHPGEVFQRVLEGSRVKVKRPKRIEIVEALTLKL